MPASTTKSNNQTQIERRDLRRDTLRVRPHSPRWPTSRTPCASGLILLADLHLVGVACLPSLSSLANISYALHVWPHSPRWPTSRRHSLSAVILLADLQLVRVARLPSFSSPDNIWYSLHVWPHSPHRPTSQSGSVTCWKTCDLFGYIELHSVVT